ncbi:uncharacterized protein [Palaemon carinicauda]|uniref:uncharacterized protein n=1 Tax=Palaemon carinicauda TaxID=392227 RepID=UPI0035B66107
MLYITRAINKEKRTTLRNIRNYRDADIASDHYLLMATLKLKLKAPNINVDRMPMFDTTNPQEDVPGETFAIECRNRFEVLQTLRDEEQTINKEWLDINNLYQSLSRDVLGHAVRRRKLWISNNTWNIRITSKEQKLIIGSFRGNNGNFKEEHAKYSRIDREVKRKARNDCREYINRKVGDDKAMNSESPYDVRIDQGIINETSSGAKNKRIDPSKREMDLL